MPRIRAKVRCKGYPEDNCEEELAEMRSQLKKLDRSQLELLIFVLGQEIVRLECHVEPDLPSDVSGNKQFVTSVVNGDRQMGSTDCHATQHEESEPVQAGSTHRTTNITHRVMQLVTMVTQLNKQRADACLSQRSQGLKNEAVYASNKDVISDKESSGSKFQENYSQPNPGATLQSSYYLASPVPASMKRPVLGCIDSSEKTGPTLRKVRGRLSPSNCKFDLERVRDDTGKNVLTTKPQLWDVRDGQETVRTHTADTDDMKNHKLFSGKNCLCPDKSHKHLNYHDRSSQNKANLPPECCDRSSQNKANLPLECYDRSSQNKANLPLECYDRSSQNKANLPLECYDRSSQNKANLPPECYDRSSQNKANLPLECYDRSSQNKANLPPECYDRSSQNKANLPLECYDRSSQNKANLPPECCDRSSQSKANLPPECCDRSSQSKANLPPECCDRSSQNKANLPPECYDRSSQNKANLPPECCDRSSQNKANLPPECYDRSSQNKANLPLGCRGRYARKETVMARECAVSELGMPLVFQNKIQDKITETYVCAICGSGFKSEPFLNHHMQTEHSRYTCMFCNKSFAYKHNLKIHQRNSHNQSLVLCSYCGKLVLQTRLDVHMEKVHEKPMYTCHICQKGFLKRECLEGHINKHSNTKPYICEFCGRKYAYSTSLSSHKKLCLRAAVPSHLQQPRALDDKGTSFICEICGTQFEGVSGLKDHHRAKHCSKSQHCSFCGKSFQWRPSYNRHIKKCKDRTDVERERCRQRPCQKPASKQYVCVCGKQYPYRQSYRRHQRNCHQKLEVESYVGGSAAMEVQFSGYLGSNLGLSTSVNIH